MKDGVNYSQLWCYICWSSFYILWGEIRKHPSQSEKAFAFPSLFYLNRVSSHFFRWKLHMKAGTVLSLGKRFGFFKVIFSSSCCTKIMIDYMANWRKLNISSPRYVWVYYKWIVKAAWSWQSLLSAWWHVEFDLFLSQKGAFMSLKKYQVNTAFFPLQCVKVKIKERDHEMVCCDPQLLFSE